MSDYLQELLPRLPEQAKVKKAENKVFFTRLGRMDGKKLDEALHDMHKKVFSYTHCLKCANCCKTTGPLLTIRDIERLSKDLNIKPRAYIDKYVIVDEDGDYVFKTKPCMYLNADNTCRVYHIRPKACREFPHTDRLNQKEILTITQKNVSVCPAVFEMVERLKTALNRT